MKTCEHLNYQNFFHYIQLHPDVQDNEIESKEELKSNAKFAVVNEAYETLGKPKERREYNKKLRMEAARDIKSQYYHHTASESNYGRMVDLSQMSARDRAKAMGYDVDPRVSIQSFSVFLD